MNHDAPRRSRATTIVALLVLSAGLFAISAGAAGVKECRGNSPTKGCPVLTPANGSVVLGSVTVTATPGNVDGAVGVQFAVDGRPIGVEDVQAPFGATWDTTQVANGTRSLSATVRAANGDLVIVRNSVTVNNPTPDTTPPSVQLTSPTAGSTVTGAVNVSANASDNIAVAGVQFKLDGANLGSEDTTSPYTTSWTSSSASNGSHTLTAVARDTAGLTTTTTATTVTVSNSSTPGDTTPPSVQLTSPTAGSTVTGAVNVSANASDNIAVAGVQFKLDGANLGSEDTTSPYTTSWTSSSASNGSHTLTAVARDTAGLTTTTTATVTVSNSSTPGDTTPPSVQLTSPTAGSTVTGAVNVSANASDNIAVAGVQFKLDGANLGSEDTTSPYTTSWTSSSASNGSHTLTAVARDTAGLTTTTTATVTVSNSVVVSGALAWAPPTLSSPITLDVRNGSNLLFLDTSKDYILRIQEKLVGNPGLYINGGRNVVVIGGTIEMNALGTSPYWDRTAIKLHNSTGVVHLEGLRLTGAYLSDGIATSAPNATIQLQNIRIDNVQAFGSEHPDCVQAQAGLGRLRVDRLTCRSTLQGIFLSDEAGYVGSADIRRVNITGTTGSNLFWQRSMGIAVSFSDVWLNPPASYATGYMTYPNVSGLTYDNQPTTRRAVLGADGVSLTYVNTNISGTVRRGVPPSGDFASSSAGTGYVSPGYAG